MTRRAQLKSLEARAHKIAPSDRLLIINIHGDLMPMGFLVGWPESKPVPVGFASGSDGRGGGRMEWTRPPNESEEAFRTRVIGDAEALGLKWISISVGPLQA